jgi:hypothetical protein
MENPILHPIESYSIQELAEIIKKGADYSRLSEKEFLDWIVSRRPMELTIIALANFSSLDSA